MESHLQTQRAAVKMLHDRIMVLVKYVADVVAGKPFFPGNGARGPNPLSQDKRPKTTPPSGLCLP